MWYHSREALTQALEEHGSINEVARQTGVARSTLQDWYKRTRSDDDVGSADDPDPVRWGFGAPGSLVLPPKTSDYVVVGLFDLHGFYREQGLFDAALRLIRDVRPDLVVVGGDAVNYDIISRWQHKVLSKMTPIALYREVKDEVRDFTDNILSPIRDAAQGAMVIGMEGNHEERLRNYLSDDLEEGWAESRRIMRVDDYLDEYYTRAGVFIRPEFLASHGEKLSKYPAVAEMEASDCSGWSGHGHWVHQYHRKPNPLTGRNLVHTRCPCMCRLDADYGPGNAGLMRWHQGLPIGNFSPTDPHDHCTDIGFWRGGKLRVRGEIY